MLEKITPVIHTCGAPKRTPQEWLLQSTGIMAALSATKANNRFLGVFFEPVLEVQIGAGANFASEKRLQKNSNLVFQSISLVFTLV